MNKRSSVANVANYNKISVQQWIEKYTASPVDVRPQFAGLAICWGNLGRAELSKVPYPDVATIFNTVPFGIPINFNDNLQTHRFCSSMKDLLDKLTNKKNSAADNSNTIYGYIILLATIVRKIIFNCPTVDEITEWSEVYAYIDHTLGVWIDNTPQEVVNELLQRIAYDGTGPDNIERTIAWTFLKKNPCLQQVIQQIVISLKRGLRCEGELVFSPLRMSKIIYANFCVNRFHNEPENIVQSILTDISENLMQQEDAMKPSFMLKHLTGFDVSPEQFETLIALAKSDSNNIPSWCVRAPEGVSVLDITYKQGVPVDPAVIELDEKNDQEGLSFDAHPSAVGGVEQWTGVKVSSGTYEISATPHYKCVVAEGNPNPAIPESCFRVVIDGSPIIMGKGYSTSGVTNVTGRFVHKQSYQVGERLFFNQPVILDLSADGGPIMRQGRLSVRVKAPVVIGFKNCNLKFRPMVSEPGAVAPAAQAPVAVGVPARPSRPSPFLSL